LEYWSLDQELLSGNEPARIQRCVTAANVPARIQRCVTAAHASVTKCGDCAVHASKRIADVFNSSGVSSAKRPCVQGCVSNLPALISLAAAFHFAANWRSFAMFRAIGSDNDHIRRAAANIKPMAGQRCMISTSSPELGTYTNRKFGRLA